MGAKAPTLIGWLLPWRLDVRVDVAQAITKVARYELTPSILHGKRGDGDEMA
jgi:hypothetical protein